MFKSLSLPSNELFVANKLIYSSYSSRLGFLTSEKFPLHWGTPEPHHTSSAVSPMAKQGGQMVGVVVDQNLRKAERFFILNPNPLK